MNKVFNFSFENSLGFSHSGEVAVEGEGQVELTETEVQQLVDLIRSHDGSSDVEELKLKETYPELYAKLDDACRDAAHHAEWIHWVIEGYECSYYEVDTEDAISKCEERYGYSHEFDKDKFLEENPDYDEDDIDEDVIADEASEAFENWVEEYRETLTPDEEASFLADVFELDPDLSLVDYEVVIPEEIVRMAEG